MWKGFTSSLRDGAGQKGEEWTEESAGLKREDEKRGRVRTEQGWEANRWKPEVVDRDKVR